MYTYIYKYIYTSPSVSVAWRQILPSQRQLRDLCSIVFGATRLKETTKKSYLKSACLIIPFQGFIQGWGALGSPPPPPQKFGKYDVIFKM